MKTTAGHELLTRWRDPFLSVSSESIESSNPQHRSEKLTGLLLRMTGCRRGSSKIMRHRFVVELPDATACVGEPHKSDSR